MNGKKPWEIAAEKEEVQDTKKPWEVAAEKKNPDEPSTASEKPTTSPPKPIQTQSLFGAAAGVETGTKDKSTTQPEKKDGESNYMALYGTFTQNERRLSELEEAVDRGRNSMGSEWLKLNSERNSLRSEQKELAGKLIEPVIKETKPLILNKEGKVSDDFKTKNMYGFEVPNLDKIREVAEQKISDPGLRRRYEAEVKGMIDFSINVPLDKLEEKTKDVYKSVYGEDALNEIQSVYQTEFQKKAEPIYAEAQAQSIALKEEMESRYQEEYVQLESQINDKVKNLNAEYQSQVDDIQKAAQQAQSEDDLGALQEQLDAINNEYKNDYDKTVAGLAGFNNSFGTRFNREAQKQQKAYEKRLETLNQEFSSEFDVPKELLDKYSKAQSIAAKQMLASSNKAKEAWASEFNPISQRYFTTTMSSVGGLVSRWGETFGIDTMRESGEEMEQYFQPDLNTVKRFKELTINNFIRSAGTLTGSMLPSMAATAATAALTKNASITTRVASTAFAGWTTETIDIAGGAYTRVLEETGSVEEAKNAASESIDSQINGIWMYAAEGLPFIGAWRKIKRMVPRIVIGGGVEYASELGQEYYQNISEEAIVETGEYENMANYISEEGFEEVAVTVAPVTVLGMAGAVQGPKQLSAEEELAKQAPGMAQQALVNMAFDKGKDKVMTQISAMYQNGLIEKGEMEAMVESFDKIDLTTDKKYNSIRFRRDELARGLESEPDPIKQKMLENEIEGLNKELSLIMEGKPDNIQEVKIGNRSYYFTESELNRIKLPAGAKLVTDETKKTEDTAAETERQTEVSGKQQQESIPIEAVKERFGLTESESAEGVLVNEPDSEVELAFSEGSEPNTVKLESIRVKESERGKGKAKEALNEVTDFADENGVTVELDVVPETEETTAEGLTRLYEQAGFETTEEGKMVRKPLTKESDIKETEEKVKEGISALSKRLKTFRIAKIGGVFDRAFKGEGINENEINEAQNALLEELEAVQQSNASQEIKDRVEAEIEKVFNELENYEFTTETKTRAVTKKRPTRVVRKGVKEQTKTPQERLINRKVKRVEGTEYTQEGFTPEEGVTTVLEEQDGKLVLQEFDESGKRTQSQELDAEGVNDLELVETIKDDNGNVVGATLRNKNNDGEVFSFLDDVLALDFAIEKTKAEVGEMTFEEEQIFEEYEQLKPRKDEKKKDQQKEGEKAEVKPEQRREETRSRRGQEEEVLGEESGVSLEEINESEGTAYSAMSSVPGLVRMKAEAKKKARTFIDGYRKARTEIKGFGKAVKEFVKTLPSTALTPAQTKRIVSKAANVTTQKQLDKFRDALNNEINKAQVRQTEDVRKAILNRTKPGKIKEQRPSGVSKGKVDSDAYKVLSMVNKAVRNLTEAQVLERLSALDDALKEESADVSAIENEMEGMLIAQKALSKNLETVQQAEEAVKQIFKTGRSNLKETLSEKHKEYRELVDRAVDSYSGGKGLLKGFDAKANKEAAKTFINRLTESIQLGLDRMEGFRTLLDRIDRGPRKKGDPYGSFSDESLYRVVAASRQQSNKLNREFQEEINDKLSEIYGSNKKARKAMNDNIKQEVVGTFTDSNGKEITITLSQNQAYYLYNLMKHPDNIGTFQEMGWTQEMMNAVKQYLTPKVKKWADWQVDYLYPKIYNQVNPVYRKMNYIDLPFIKNYVPIRRKGVEQPKDQSIDGFKNNMVDLSFGAFKERIKSRAPFDPSQDGDSLLYQHANNMNHYVAFAEAIKKLNVVFGDKTVREVLRQNNNKDLVEVIDRFIESFTNQGNDKGQVFGLLDKLRGWMSTSTLAISPVITLKQLSSIPAYLSDIPVAQWTKGTSKFIANPTKAYKTLNKSEYIKDRYKRGFDRDMAIALARDYKKAFTGQSTFLDKLMFNVKWGDKGAILFGGYAVYDYFYNKGLKQGMSKTEAEQYGLNEFDEATKMSQQAANTEDLSDFQRGGSFPKLFTMYKTTPFAYFRQERKSIRDFMRGAKEGDKSRIRNATKRFMIYHFVLPVIFQYMANGLPGLVSDWEEGDDDELSQDAIDLIRAATIGSLNGIFIVGDLLGWVGDLLTDKPWARRGSFSGTSVFRPLTELAFELTELVGVLQKDRDEFEKEILSALLDVTIKGADLGGMPASRIEKMVSNYNYLIKEYDDLSKGDIAALYAGYTPWQLGLMGKKKAKKKPPKKTSIIVNGMEIK